MPWIKATDIAYGRFRAPDLDVMEEFLTRFGLVRSERTPTALYMRGTEALTSQWGEAPPAKFLNHASPSARCSREYADERGPSPKGEGGIACRRDGPKGCTRGLHDGVSLD